MVCKYCGTAIADKALICYKCGNATAEARVAPPPRRRKRRGQLTAIVVLALLVLALLVAWLLGALPL